MNCQGRLVAKVYESALKALLLLEHCLWKNNALKGGARSMATSYSDSWPSNFLLGTGGRVRRSRWAFEFATRNSSIQDRLCRKKIMLQPRADSSSRKFQLLELGHFKELISRNKTYLGCLSKWYEFCNWIKIGKQLSNDASEIRMTKIFDVAFACRPMRLSWTARKVKSYIFLQNLPTGSFEIAPNFRA